LSNIDESSHRHVEEGPPYTERKIESFEELATIMRAMDQDEGLRVQGRVEGFKGGGFIFMAKSGSRYCIQICDRIDDPASKTFTVGGNDVWMYFDTFEEAWEKLKSLAVNPLEAYSY
jgi:hypothetical protein